MGAKEARATSDQHALAGVIFPGRGQRRSPLESIMCRVWTLKQSWIVAREPATVSIMQELEAARTPQSASVRFCDGHGLWHLVGRGRLPKLTGGAGPQEIIEGLSCGERNLMNCP